MIKFFKHIRQKLLSENKFSKYLLYAIGEIVLVVIGILIALQINNWNDTRKQQDREIQTLKQLHTESVQIINTINADMALMDGYIKAVKTTVKDLKQGCITKNDTLEFAKGVIGVSFYPAVSIPRNVYDEIKSAGLLREIKSDDVRNTIAKFYADLNWLESQLHYFRDVTLANGYSNVEGFYSEFDDSNPLMRKYDIDFEHLKTNKRFRTNLSRGLRNLIVFQENRQRLLDAANSMHDALESAL